MEMSQILDRAQHSVYFTDSYSHEQLILDPYFLLQVDGDSKMKCKYSACFYK